MRDTEKDFFRDDELVADPYPYFDCAPRRSAPCGASRTTTS